MLPETSDAACKKRKQTCEKGGNPKHRSTGVKLQPVS